MKLKSTVLGTGCLLILGCILIWVAAARRYPDFVNRLAADRGIVEADGKSIDLDRLIASATEDEIFHVLWHAHDKGVRLAIAEHLIDAKAFPDSEILRRNSSRLIETVGSLNTISLFVKRGDKFAFQLLLEAFRKLEDGNPKDPEQLKKMTGLNFYLFEITGRHFRDSAQFAEWIRNDLPSFEFDMTELTGAHELRMLRPKGN